MDEDKNKEVKAEIMNIDDSTNAKKALTSGNISPAHFISLVKGEFNSINRSSKALKKIEKYIYSDDFIFSLEPKEVIRLFECIARYKGTSMSLLTKLYEVSSKNDILRSYFDDKKNGNMLDSSGKPSKKLQDIINNIRKKTKSLEDE